MESNDVKIILADDNKMQLDSFVALFDRYADMSLVGIAQNGVELLSLLPQLNPDIILLDLEMPRMDGIEVLDKIDQWWPNLYVIIVTQHNSPKLVQRCLKYDGVRGYILKSAGEETLIQGIVTVMRGDRFIPDDVHATSAINCTQQSIIPRHDFEKKYELTNREIEVIQYIALGKSTSEIATILAISEMTVSTHRKHIKQKLNTQNLADLIRFAYKNRLI